MTAPKVTLSRDSRCYGSIGGRYYWTDPTGTRWVVEGGTGIWFIGLDIDSMTPDQCREYIARDKAEGNPGTIVSTLAAARAWLLANVVAA